MKLGRIFRAALICIVLVLALAVSAYAADDTIGTATVTTEVLRMRAEPTTQSPIMDMLLEGTKVDLLEEKWDWCKVTYKGQTGYVCTDYVTITYYKTNLGWGMVDTDGEVLRLRAKPSTGSDVLDKVPSWTWLELEEEVNGWFKVTYNGQTGYVFGDYINRDVTETVAEDPVPMSYSPSPYSYEVPAGSGVGDQAVAIALQYVGYPYVYGGKGPYSFDCSGFVYYVYSQLGYELTGGSTNQWLYGPGQRIYSMDEMIPGDLFFINDPHYGGGKATSHVGIYIGDGLIVHASTPSTGVIISSIYESWHAPYFVGALRVG